MTTPCLDNPNAMGIRQYAIIALGQRRVDILPNLFNHLSYCQSLIFIGDTDRTNHIKKALAPFNPLSLCGEISDDERKKVKDVWRKFGTRVMILTDTTSDGLDDQYVNLVLNLNLPDDCTTFMQRVARAHFTGESGTAITILTTQQDVVTFLAMVKNDSLTVKVLDIKTEYPHDITFNQSFYAQANDFVEFCDNVQAAVGAVATRAHKEQEPPKKVYAGAFVSPKTESGKEAGTHVNVAPAAQTQEASKTTAGGVEASNSTSSINLSGNENDGPMFAIPAQQNSRKSSHQPQMATTPPHLPLINVDVVRKFFPDFEYDIEAAKARAIEARDNNPGVPNEPPFNFKKKDRGGFASNFCGSGFGGGNGSGLSNRDIFGEHGSGTNAGFGSNSGGFGNGQENVGGFGGQIGPRKFFRPTDEGDVQMYPGQGGGFGERGGNVGRVDGNRRDGFGGQANIFQNGNANGAAAGFNQHNQVVNGYQQSDAPPRRRFIR